VQQSKPVGIMTRKLDPEKLAKLHNADEWLDDYGKEGTPTREAHRERAYKWYYGELLKERRKELRLTQKQFAEKVGKKREYISALEKGETDMQLSTFFNIAGALGLRFDLCTPEGQSAFGTKQNPV
jgi:DNA-binding XRE family transcriptional regulator